jgi:hypothetical protein
VGGEQNGNGGESILLKIIPGALPLISEEKAPRKQLQTKSTRGTNSSKITEGPVWMTGFPPKTGVIFFQIEENFGAWKIDNLNYFTFGFAKIKIVS